MERRVQGLWASIWTASLSNMKQGYYPLDSDVRYLPDAKESRPFLLFLPKSLLSWQWITLQEETKEAARQTEYNTWSCVEG